MYTLTLIALLAATGTNMAGGFGTHGRHSHQGHAKKYDENDNLDSSHETWVICAEENGATEDDLLAFAKNYGKPLDKYELKCVAGCFFEWRKILVDGKFDKEEYKKTQSVVLGEENAAKGADYCQEKLADVSTNICELGGAFFDCENEVFTKYSPY